MLEALDPQAQIVGPSTDSSFCGSSTQGTQVTLKVKVTNSDHLTATVDIIAGSTTIAQGLIPDPVDSTARYTVTIPAANGVYHYTGIVRNNGNMAFSPVRTFTVNCPVTSLAGNLVLPTWAAYPNPSNGVVYVKSQDISGKLVNVSVHDMTGKLVYMSSQMATGSGFTHQVETANLPKGIYTVSLLALVFVAK